jgi:hypothetical protein
VASLKLPTALGWRFGVIVLLLAILSLALGTQNAVDNNRNTRCLAQYAQRQAEVSGIRSEATGEKDAAVAGLLDRVTALILDPPAGDSGNLKLRRAAERYRSARIELDAKREANPLPAFPQQCSDVNK